MRNRYILVADLPLIAFAAFGAFALRFDLLFPRQRPEFVPFLLAALVVKPLIFYAFGMYGRYWKYASAQDLVAVTLAVSGSSMAMAVFVVAATAVDLVSSFSRQVIFIDWLLTLAAVGGLRMSVRIIGDAQQRAEKGNGGATPKRVLVIGAGEAGSLVVREMQRNPQLALLPVGFLDDSPVKLGKWMHGVRVLGSLAALAEVVRTHQVAEVVIAMPRASGSVLRAVAESCRQVGVTSLTMPGVFELLDGHVSVNRLRKVEIADLLRRPQVVDRAERVSYLEDRTVLITGAGGSIGGELSRQVAFSRPKRLVLLGHGENSIFAVHASLKEQYPDVGLHPVIADVRNPVRLDAILGRFKPDVVFHAAAHKHVPLMEANPEEAFTNNVRGTQSILRASERHGVRRFVLISTDKAVAPSSIMGASKRLAESLVISAGVRTSLPYVVVRFGNVLGSRGSVVPTLRAQIERGGPVTVTHPDMKRFFMTIPEAVQLVLQAGGMGTGGDLFVLNMGEQLKVLDLANDLIRLSGVDPTTIPIVFAGIRPGEKLEETLWEPDASVEATSNPDVFRVREHDLQVGLDIQPMVEEVIVAAESGDVERLGLSLTMALPSYARRPAVAAAVSPPEHDRRGIH